MKSESVTHLAENIATILIDKTFWGDQWFLFFCALLFCLIASISAWSGTYISTRAQNSAIRTDFEKALANIERQTEAVKRLEEEISHIYLETREITRIKREKIEALYLGLESERERLGHNLRVVALDLSEDVVNTPFTVEMLIALYFKNQLNKELTLYQARRNALIVRIRELSEENLHKKGLGSISRLDSNREYFTNYIDAVKQIKTGLEEMMRDLTNLSSGDQKNQKIPSQNSV